MANISGMERLELQEIIRKKIKRWVDKGVKLTVFATDLVSYQHLYAFVYYGRRLGRERLDSLLKKVTEFEL